VVGIVISLVLAGIGLWIGTDQSGTEMAGFGWLLLAVGLAFLVVNLYLRSRGFRTPRRRR
jgi:hypothetical protein